MSKRMSTKVYLAIEDGQMTDLLVTRGNKKDIILQAFHWNLVKTKGTGTLDGQKIFHGTLD
jgi:hypothetical protein